MNSRKLLFKKNYRWLLFQISLIVTLFAWQNNYAQNTCATAVPITAGQYTIGVIDGTNIPTTCSTPALAEWYVYTPTQNWNVTITSDLPQNICKDTNFEVYTGNCGALVCFSGDDDSGILTCNSGNTNSYLSVKTFEVTAGTTYYINWNNQWNQTAGFDFQLIEAAIVPNPCNTATPITAGITTVTAIDVSTTSTACSTASMAKWYRYTPTQSYEVTISSDLIENICKDTNFNVYTGSCSALTCFTSDDNSGIIQCNSGNTDSNLSKKTFLVNAGTTYYIAWDNKWSSAGFNFELTEAVIPPPRITYNSQTISSTNSSSYNLCIVDMNGDHKDDLVGVSGNNVKIHYQTDTPGSFAVVDFPILGTSFMPSWSMAAGDFNKDGYNDLVLGSGSGLSLWKSNSSGTGFTNTTPGEYIFCQRTNFADLNNDGNLDVFSCHDIAPNVYYLNDGAGGMTYYQSNTTPGAMNLDSGGGNYATLFTDFDNDGDTDVFISKCSGPPCLLFRNDGEGTYTNVSAMTGVNITPIQTWSSAIADFDNDGDMDIIITASANGHHYLKNNFETTNTLSPFTEITLGSGWDTNTSTNIDNIAYDFDNDGFVDVMGGGNKIMFNQGDGTFAPTSYTISVGAVGDLNNDGFLDIQNGSTIRYAVPNGNNWLKVSLNGIQSNSNGIGARIEIYGAWGKQIRDIRSGEGFKYMSSLNGHFGLGTATTIDQVVVKWPSGVVDTYYNVPINGTLNTVEGSTLSVATSANTMFKVYPNPAKNIITIQQSNTATASLARAEIYDLNGRMILEKDMQNLHTISVESLSTGTYILLLVDANANRYTQKIIKE